MNFSLAPLTHSKCRLLLFVTNKQKKNSTLISLLSANARAHTHTHTKTRKHMAHIYALLNVYAINKQTATATLYIVYCIVVSVNFVFVIKVP